MLQEDAASQAASAVSANRTGRKRLPSQKLREDLYQFRAERALPAVQSGPERAPEHRHVVSGSERNLRLIERGAGQTENVQKWSAQVLEEQVRKRAAAEIGNGRPVFVQVELALLLHRG